MTKHCPTCGQPLLTWHGVRLPPKQAAILDMIARASKGRGGIALNTLAWVFYPDVDTTRARQRIKTHVCQINDRLVSTERRIMRRSGDGRYYFEPAP
jgi:hypothetical protein